jgi:hypothetical protein
MITNKRGFFMASMIAGDAIGGCCSYSSPVSCFKTPYLPSRQHIAADNHPKRLEEAKVPPERSAAVETRRLIRWCHSYPESIFFLLNVIVMFS